MVRVTEAVGYFKPEWFTEWVLKVGKAEANRTSKKALKIGTRIDEIIRSGIYEANKKDTKEVKKCLQNFLSWKSRNGAATIIPLSRIDNESIGLTGCADLYWEEKEDLIDFKSSKRISPEMFFQLGGYKRLGFKAKRLAILICDKEEDMFDYKTNEDYGLSLDQCVDAFESAYKHYKYYTYIKQQIGDENA